MPGKITVTVTVNTDTKLSFWECVKWRVLFGKRRHEIIDAVLKKLDVPLQKLDNTSIAPLQEPEEGSEMPFR